MSQQLRVIIGGLLCGASFMFIALVVAGLMGASLAG